MQLSGGRRPAGLDLLLDLPGPAAWLAAAPNAGDSGYGILPAGYPAA